MKRIAIALAGTAFVALAGCNQGAEENITADNAAEANALDENATEAADGNATNSAGELAPDGKPVEDAAAGAQPEKPVANESAPAEQAAGEKPTN